MKRILAIICILGVLFFAIDSFISIMFQENYNPLHRLVTEIESNNTISDLRIFRNVFTGELFFDAHSYYGKMSRTKLVTEYGYPIYWDWKSDYQNRFVVVFKLEADEDGHIYQTMIDKDTNVMYRFYLNSNAKFDVQLEITENGFPRLWEGKIPLQEKPLT